MRTAAAVNGAGLATAQTLRPASAVQWRAVAALSALVAFLLSPVAVYELRRALAEGPDKLILFTLPASLLWLISLHALVRRPQRLHLLLFPFYVAAGYDLYLAAMYQTRLSSSTLALVLDNLDSASGYLGGHWAVVGISAVAGVTLYALLLRELKRIQFSFRPSRRWWPFAALLLLYLGVGIKQGLTLHSAKLGALDLVSHDRSSPLGVLPQGAIAWLVHRESTRMPAPTPLGASRAEGDPRRVVVLVLGESSRPDHWSLYGYSRRTTPRLEAREDLVVFRDVTTQAALTALSVPLMLGRNDAATFAQRSAEGSIVTAFREAGYRTEWLSSQQRDQWTGQLNRQADEAEHRRFFERRRDGVLVDALAESLAAARKDGASLFAVLHTQGSHFEYCDRYPKQSRRFPQPGEAPRTPMVDCYDNSVAYTDEVLDRVIAQLEGEDAPAAMLYVSDHGENLRDDARGLMGHFYSNEFDLPVPMVLWVSPEWARRDPARAAEARRHAAARLSTDAVFYTVADLGQVDVAGDPGFAARSLLRPTFTERPRRFLTADEAVGDFDQRFGARHAGLPAH